MVGHGLGQPLRAVTLERSKLALILQKIHRAQRQSRVLVSFVDGDCSSSIARRPVRHGGLVPIPALGGLLSLSIATQ